MITKLLLATVVIAAVSAQYYMHHPHHEHHAHHPHHQHHPHHRHHRHSSHKRHERRGKYYIYPLPDGSIPQDESFARFLNNQGYPGYMPEFMNPAALENTNQPDLIPGDIVQEGSDPGRAEGKDKSKTG
ncbi:uncharacterized protein LOC142973101 [Anticarsia gemmatalis]|uniref:uncharacterized protein LOC142973101 n=1 Tax=Anticarsia gemmatalis TaxID=129554 RepID=UPI003F75F3B7